MFLITFFFVLTLFYYRIDGRLESVNCIVPTLWLIVSILAYINPLNLYPITIYGQLVVSLYFFAYFVGYALLAYFVKENTVSQYRYEKVSYNYGYLATSGIIFIVLLLSIRFWSVFIDFISLYGFAGLFNAGIQVYSNRGTDLSIGLGVLLPIDYLSIFLGIVWFRTVKNRGLFKKIVYGYMMIIPFLLAFLIQSRLNIVIMFILYLNLNYLYRVKVINFRILLYLILCIFAISISRGIEMNSNLFGDSFFARILAGISYYTSIGLFAFDQFLNSTVSSSDYANYTFNGALR